MGDFEDKLDSILNNPQAMSQIMSLAQSLGGNEQKAHSEPTPSQPENFDFPFDPGFLSGMTTLFSQYNQNDDQRVALLNALRPFVKEHRYAKLDKAIQIAKMSRMARMALELFKAKEGSDV